jgi:CheY-like chemotaxis protein
MAKKRTDGAIEILLVEDNPADVILMEEILDDAGIVINLNTATDGEEAMAYLRREGVYAEEPFPDMVILDLNIPRKHGLEVLREIKEDEKLKHIPVIILTTSKAESDIRKSYRMHANCYIVKPVGPEDFIRMMKSLETFWCHTASFPRSS